MRSSKIARIPINRLAMLTFGGISSELIKQMLDHMPSDTKLVGCGNDSAQCVDYLFFTSSLFEDVQEGQVIPDITPTFVREFDNSGNRVDRCTGVDFGKALSATCQHDWQLHTGFRDTYYTCKICGVKQ